jgi:hypothetical protein
MSERCFELLCCNCSAEEGLLRACRFVLLSHAFPEFMP